LVDDAKNNYPMLNWSRGVVTFGAVSHPELRVSGSEGCVEWGRDDPPANALETQLIQLSSRFRWHTCIEPLLVKKWMFNAVINTLTAAHGLSRNGGLLPDYKKELRVVAEEVHEYARNCWPLVLLKFEDFWQSLLKLIADTSENENSMARDLRLGQRTEAEFLSGLMANGGNYPEVTRLDAIIREKSRRLL
jgi:ketopantoate reductase